MVEHVWTTSLVKLERQKKVLRSRPSSRHRPSTPRAAEFNSEQLSPRQPSPHQPKSCDWCRKRKMWVGPSVAWPVTPKNNLRGFWSVDHTGIVGVVKNHVDLSEDHQTLYWFKCEKKSTKKIFFVCFHFVFPPRGLFFLSIFSFLSFSFLTVVSHCMTSNMRCSCLNLQRAVIVGKEHYVWFTRVFWKLTKKL